MTLHYPETDAAPNSYTPPNDTVAVNTARTEETIVPIYARKAPKRSPQKKLLWAIPVVVALGVTGAALMMGERSREDANPADTDGLTTSRLSSQTSEAPAAEPLAVQATPTPDAVAPAAAPSLRPAPAPARATTTTRTTRTTAPARRATPTRSSAPAPVRAAPLPQETLAPVVVETTPPASVAPTPTLPPEPQPTVTPPATATPPGPGGL